MKNCQHTSIQVRQHSGSWAVLAFCLVPIFAPLQHSVFATDDPPDEPTSYSDAVVARAESILLENGMKRVGSQIQATLQSDLTRLFADETKQTRGLKLARTATEDAETQFALLQKQIVLTEQKVGQLNAQFVIQGNPQGRNNELVATINAMTAQLKQIIAVRDTKKEEVAKLKANLGELEENYAETILKMRCNVDSIKEIVGKANEVRDVGIALKVLATRYSNSTDLDIESMIAAGSQGSQVRSLSLLRNDRSRIRRGRINGPGCRRFGTGQDADRFRREHRIDTTRSGRTTKDQTRR